MSRGFVPPSGQITEWQRNVAQNVNPLIQGYLYPQLDSDPASPQVGLTYYNTTANQVRTWNGTRWIPLTIVESIPIVCSDETTALTTGTAKVTFRMPYAFTVTAVRASLSTAQATGTIFTVDVNEAGTSILSTKLTIDNTEKTSVTAATPAVISDSALADDAEISVDIDQIGDGTAKGLKVVLIGHQ